uniref:SecA_DEAD domain-containing protein n=1 Tax=Globodera pallida TaxID=36090 RepID=A0A183CIR1_GLOPA
MASTSKSNEHDWTKFTNLNSSDIEEVKRLLKGNEGHQKQRRPISNWSKDDIISWAGDLKRQRHARAMPELLAVACRACKIAHGYYPRDAQLHSILVMLSPSKAGLRGHLLQIATGEGKTAILALFVVVKALRDGVKGRQLKITFYVTGMEYLENLLMMCFCGTLKSVSEEAIEGEVCRAEDWKHLKHFVGDLETQLANMINNNLRLPRHTGDRHTEYLRVSLTFSGNDNDLQRIEWKTIY